MKLNAKVRKLALKRSFTERIDENSVVVVDKFEFAEPKTKGAVAALKSMNLFGDKKKPAKILILINDYDVNSILAVAISPMPVCSMFLPSTHSMCLMPTRFFSPKKHLTRLSSGSHDQEYENGKNKSV